MSATPNRESIEQRLQSFKAILRRQDEEWQQMRDQLEAAGDTRFVVDELPEISINESLERFANATRA
jgi:hypothetical protein